MPSKKLMICFIIGMLVIGLSLVPLQNTQATSNIWKPGEWVPCSKCHPDGIAEAKSVYADQTINTALCRNCHDTVSFSAPPSTDAEKAHSAHIGGLPGKGTITRHPDPANLLRTVDIKDCLVCHRSLSGGLAGWNCTSCHDPATSEHISAYIGENCSTCHGALPNITYHSAQTLVDGKHKVFGTGRAGCFACHENSTGYVDKYRWVNGTKINYDESHKLCWQCHYTYYKAWMNGTHHDSTRGSCTSAECHDPHNPYLSKIGISPEYPSILQVPVFGLVPPLFVITIVIALAIIGLVVMLVVRSRRK